MDDQCGMILQVGEAAKKPLKKAKSWVIWSGSTFLNINFPSNIEPVVFEGNITLR